MSGCVYMCVFNILTKLFFLITTKPGSYSSPRLTCVHLPHFLSRLLQIPSLKPHCILLLHHSPSVTFQRPEMIMSLSCLIFFSFQLTERAESSTRLPQFCPARSHTRACFSPAPFVDLSCSHATCS